ncbi:hypothetical protein [Actinopolymorpha rutila]|uniref:Uncharacterized protein n=1 Tax=Actinopolymorpha rutila TaxID=446787 RepID=A0A852ZM27_9ACTN|nr:hypothetical protein [Actinopolymorpha rutila]NYH92928.1 hypothetical protein [Actinopolymorpha rutila]
MSVTVADIAGPETTRRRRRGWVGLLVGVVAAGMIAAAVYATTYQPLANTDGLFWAGSVAGPLTTFTLGPAGRSTPNVFGDEVRVGPLRHGTRFGLMITLRNTGPVPVTIEGVGSLLGPISVSDARGFAARDETDPASAFVPVAGITIPGHSNRTVAVAAQLRDCPRSPPGTSTSVRELRFTYRILGVRRTAPVPLKYYAATLLRPPTCRN